MAERAYSLILQADGDTAQDLANHLRRLANDIDRGTLNSTGLVAGVGGSTSGSIWSYTVDPTRTHDRYFDDIAASFAAFRTEQTARKTNGVFE